MIKRWRNTKNPVPPSSPNSQTEKKSFYFDIKSDFITCLLSSGRKLFQFVSRPLEGLLTIATWGGLFCASPQRFQEKSLKTKLMKRKEIIMIFIPSAISSERTFPFALLRGRSLYASFIIQRFLLAARHDFVSFLSLTVFFYSVFDNDWNRARDEVHEPRALVEASLRATLPNGASHRRQMLCCRFFFIDWKTGTMVDLTQFPLTLITYFCVSFNCLLLVLRGCSAKRNEINKSRNIKRNARKKLFRHQYLFPFFLLSRYRKKFI